MFYLFKHLVILILIILKLKCNNLIFNEILILYASYMCLLHSRFIENHVIWILEDGPLIYEVLLSHPSPTWLNTHKIAPCVDSLMCYGPPDGLSLSLKKVPKSKVRLCIYTFYLRVVITLI
jgi:hypothetical protein